MDQDNKNQSGAPSSDTTSALFVSARKKQLEQQEAERRQREKEEQRLAAEAEVRRLEQEVLERKRRAEEEAIRVEQETAEKRRQAEEASRRMMAESAAASQMASVSGTGPSKATTPLVMPQTGGTAAAKAPSKKMLIIIGGAVLAVILVVVLILVFSNGGKDPGRGASGAVTSVSSEVTSASSEVSGGDDTEADEPGAIIPFEDAGGAPAGLLRFNDDKMRLAFNYSPELYGEIYRAGGSNLPYDFVIITAAEGDGVIFSIANLSDRYNTYVDNGGTDGDALVESLISDMCLMLKIKLTDLTDLTYAPSTTNPDGSIRFSATWSFPNGAKGYASMTAFQDQETAKGIFSINVLNATEENIQMSNDVINSVEVW